MESKSVLIWEKIIKKTNEHFPGIANKYIFIINKKGIIINISHGLQKDLGFTDADLDELSIFDILDDSDNNDISEILKKLLSGNTIITLKGKNKNKLKIRVFLEKGNFTHETVYLCFAVPAMDIEPANFYSSEFIINDLEKISDITRNGIIVWIKNKDVFTSNNHFYWLIGCQPLEFKPTYKNLIKIIHLNFQDIIKEQLQNLWSGELSFIDEEVMLRQKNDEYLWALFRARAIEWDKNNKPSKIIIVLTDISKFKTKETTLIQEIEKFKRLADIPNAGTFIFDNTGTILDINKELTNILKYSKDEIIGTKFFKFFPLEYHKLITKQIANNNFKPIDIKIITNNNILLDIEINISRYLFEGLVTYYVSIKPIPDRKKTEMELLNAKIKAEENANIKTAFLSNMSHEIRTPINGIIGFIDLLKNASLSESERNEYIDIINNRSLMLLNIIDDIVDVSKIEAGQLTLTEEEFDVVKLLNDNYQLFEKIKYSLDKEHIDLRLIVPNIKHNRLIVTDPLRLKQILSNLLNNALKFTHSGYVEFGYTIKNLDFLEFFVNDTGSGIPEEQLIHIYERFWQLENLTRKKYKGSGLGLPICKGLVELLGGELIVESIVNKGTIFKFTIPYKQSIELNDINIAQLKSKNVYNWSEKNILLVEDDEINMKYLDIVLKSTGVKLYKAVNGQQSVDLCYENKDIDLILMDIQLPVLDGFEAFAQIRKFNKTVPIIAQTGFAMNEEKVKCLKAGFNKYISKPINKILLFQMIDELLNK